MNENSAARGGLLEDQNLPATRMNARSEVATCALPEVSLRPLPANQHELLRQAANVLDWAGRCYEASARPHCATESRQFAEALRSLAAESLANSTLLTGIDCADGLRIGVQGGAAAVLAESFAEQFKASGAINFLEMKFVSKEEFPGESFVVTVQRANGETPAEQIKALKAKLAAAKDNIKKESA